VAQTSRDEQKLRLILLEVKRVRTRLNSLALQHWLFRTLALLVGGIAMVLVAALLLGPLSFLFAAVAIVLFGLAGMIRTGRAALRMRATPLTAAAIADERAALKGRLTTVLAMAEAPKHSVLWPYLLEDTYGRRAEFEPARIEPRWISRSVFGLITACLIAALLLPFASLRSGAPRVAADSLPEDVTADISNLDIRPADPALEPNAEVYADDAILRKLDEKAAAAQREENNKGGFSRWMDKARDVAGDLQHKLTGQNSAHHPPARLKLTDKNPDASQSGSPGNNDRPDRAGQSGSQAQNGQNNPDKVPGHSQSGNLAGGSNNPSRQWHRFPRSRPISLLKTLRPSQVSPVRIRVRP
jgi:hypothetical protein